jgi:hypothetical protein
MDMSSLIKATKEVRKFVEVGGLAEALSVFGDVEHKAAQEVLRTLHLAEDKRAHVHEAVVHLRSAHSAYEEAIRLATSGIKKYLTMYKIKSIFSKAILSHCLMAVCYRYLGEKALMQETIDRAIEIERTYPGNRTIQQIGLKSLVVIPVAMIAYYISAISAAPIKIFHKLIGKSADVSTINSIQLLEFKAALAS